MTPRSHSPAHHHSVLGALVIAAILSLMLWSLIIGAVVAIV